ncbi:MAG TPA: hypothetical protein VK645_11825 [Chitinophagaceae bacterium]|nr:hypothetical protein [Chitinophagaceae bacterium]
MENSGRIYFTAYMFTRLHYRHCVTVKKTYRSRQLLSIGLATLYR